eukprot:191613_1
MPKTIEQSMVMYIIFISLVLTMLSKGNNITVTNQTSPIICNENEPCYINCKSCSHKIINCPTNNNCLIDCIQCNDTQIYCNGNSDTECTINCMADPYNMDPEALHGCYSSTFDGGKSGNVYFNCFDSYTCGDSNFYCTNSSETYLSTITNTNCSIYCENMLSCYDRTEFEGLNAKSVNLTCIDDQSCYETSLECSTGVNTETECYMSCHGVESCFDSTAKAKNAKYVDFRCIGDYSCASKYMDCSISNAYSICNIDCIGDFSCEETIIEGRNSINTNLQCLGDYSCYDSNIDCSDRNHLSECIIDCFGNYSCGL